MRLLLTAGLMLLAAGLAPALAQSRHAACTQHNTRDMRCAVHFTNAPAGRYQVVLNISGSSTPTEGLASVWVSACGFPGRQVHARPLSNRSDQRLLDNVAGDGSFALCVEVFVTNCSPVSCFEGFRAAATSLTVTRQGG